MKKIIMFLPVLFIAVVLFAQTMWRAKHIEVYTKSNDELIFQSDSVDRVKIYGDTLRITFVNGSVKNFRHKDKLVWIYGFSKITYLK